MVFAWSLQMSKINMRESAKKNASVSAIRILLNFTARAGNFHFDLYLLGVLCFVAASAL